MKRPYQAASNKGPQSLRENICLNFLTPSTAAAAATQPLTSFTASQYWPFLARDKLIFPATHKKFA